MKRLISVYELMHTITSWRGYTLDYCFAVSSDFRESCYIREVARQPEETLDVFTLLFLYVLNTWEY